MPLFHANRNKASAKDHPQNLTRQRARYYHHARQRLSAQRHLMIVDASMKLALVIVLGADLPASKLPALIESIHGVEGAEHRLKVYVHGAVLVGLV